MMMMTTMMILGLKCKRELEGGGGRKEYCRMKRIEVCYVYII
jgi:hypothetical protein